jgi:hypothetical protein
VLALEQRVKALEDQARGVDKVAWLIEVGRPVIYYLRSGDWCSNPNHAHRFATEAEALEVIKGLQCMEPPRACEHSWG